MKTISIRVEDNVFKKIEMLRGSKSKSDFCRELLEDRLDKNEDDSLQNEYKNLQIEYEKLQTECEALKGESQHLREIMGVKDERIKDLQNQNGFLVSEYQTHLSKIYKISLCFDQICVVPNKELVQTLSFNIIYYFEYMYQDSKMKIMKLEQTSFLPE